MKISSLFLVIFFLCFVDIIFHFEIRIPSERFQNIFNFCIENGIDLKEAFTFNVKGNEYSVLKASAILGSETVLNEFLKNKEISRFDINIDDPKNLFINIISLFQGNSIAINPEDYSFYLKIISLLKIEPVYPQIKNVFNEELKLINCIDTLNNKRLFGFPINNEIDFISKNFYMFESKDILKIDKDGLIQILNNTSLKIKNDDDFIRLIVKIVKENKNYQFMFDYVHYENLSEEILNDPLFKNVIFTPYVVKKLILHNHELKTILKCLYNKINDLDIQEAYDFLLNNGYNQKYQKMLVEFCFLTNDFNLINDILELKNFDFNIKYDIYSNFMIFTLKI